MSLADPFISTADRRMRFDATVTRVWRVPASIRSIAVLVAALLLLAVPVASAKNKTAISSFEAGVLQKLNETRAAHGLGPLKLSMRLTTAADAHSIDMADNGYFDHSSHDGTPFWKRVDQWYGSSGYRYWSVGENILWASPSLTPGRAISMWMASPEHRANILNAQWHEIGVAAVHVPAGSGIYHGLPVTIITTDFGARR
jgi:uncharacterized protein YkwD